MTWKSFIEEFRFLGEDERHHEVLRMTPSQLRDFEKAVEAYLPQPGRTKKVMNPEQRADFEKALENFGFRTRPPALSPFAKPTLA